MPVNHVLWSFVRQYITQLIASQISAFSRYYEQLLQWKPQPHDDGLLLQKIRCSSKSVAEILPKLAAESRSLILLNANLNHELDIQALLTEVHQQINRYSRVVIVTYNPYFKALYRLANHLGIRRGGQPSTFMTHTELKNLAKLSGFEVVQSRPLVYSPLSLFGVGDFLNSILPVFPLLRHLGLVSIVLLRPLLVSRKKPSLSIVIPARNEKGNIEAALQRMPSFPTKEVEVIFVEGHSTDGTWEEIQKVSKSYEKQFSIKMLQQQGVGKNDAVRTGFANASGELLTILDADLTMPPEQLVRFYEAYCQGVADFINGNRLLYPMEGEAMRFLNRLGNVLFAKMLSRILGISLGDSLCGTKLFSRQDYQRIVSWRDDFGDFDPFGDYELLFPAAVLGMGIVDIPIRYGARVYGSTNIHRFSHGWMLLKMMAIGFRHLTLGQVR